jgi:hypothetical protein
VLKSKWKFCTALPPPGPVRISSRFPEVAYCSRVICPAGFVVVETRNAKQLEIEEAKTRPYLPLSHPSNERLISTLRRESLDQVAFWTARDLVRKLVLFKEYYNRSGLILH